MAYRQATRSRGRGRRHAQEAPADLNRVAVQLGYWVLSSFPWVGTGAAGCYGQPLGPSVSPSIAGRLALPPDPCLAPSRRPARRGFRKTWFRHKRRRASSKTYILCFLDFSSVLRTHS